VLASSEQSHSGGTNMERATARLWKEAGRWVIQVDFDGIPYTERDYDDVASATQAIAQILRGRAERSSNLDEDACETCDEPLDFIACSQCGADGFVRSCEDGGPRPLRILDGAIYCRVCRP
jgi:hypothetical protein